MTLIIKHGLRRTTRMYAQPPTVAEIKSDQTLRDELGFGDNCRVLINGVEQSDRTYCPGPEVSIETAANQKASAQP